MITKVIIPAFNEEQSIGLVVEDALKEQVEEVIVVSNNSTDNTISVAQKAGATVLEENQKGYGYACLKGINYVVSQKPMADIIVFMDGDFSDYSTEMPFLINEIKEGADMVIGNRVKSKRIKGSMTPQQVFGNWLACWLMKIFYGYRYYDLGPYRAIKTDKLLALDMQDKTYGWTVEMQLKALKQKLKIAQVDVSYRKRIGKSKVSGTIKGTIMAGYKIIYTIFKYR